MERELLLTGIGGQGVQLAAQVIAGAATLEGREVMFFGIYGGMMRGGNTDSTVVVADAADHRAAGGLEDVVGHRDAPRVLGADRAKLRPDGVVLCNSTVFDPQEPVDRAAHQVFDIPATEVAAVSATCWARRW